MAGARVPNNGPPLDTATSALAVRFPEERYPGPVEFMGSAQNAPGPTYAEFVASAQTLYSQVWEELRKFADAYSVSRPQKQQQQQLAGPSATSLRDFNTRNPNNLDHHSYEVPSNVDTSAVDVSNLMSAEDDPTSLDNESGTLAPTIQFDLGNNLYSSAPGPYVYSNDANMATQVNSGQTCFANDSPLTSTVSTVWSPGHSFTSSKRSNLSSNNLDNVSTVDYTTRWDVHVDNNLQNRSLTNHSSAPSGNSNIQTATAAGAECAETFERKVHHHQQQQQQQSMVLEPSVQQSIEGALAQRFYLVDKVNVGDLKDSNACDFLVVGSDPGGTGNNVNTVRFSTVPRCTCSDAQLPCPHILFIMVRVLKMSPGDYRFWQMPLPSSLVAALLSDVFSHKRVRDGGGGSGGGGGGDEAAELQTFPGAKSGYCPICFEVMNDQDGNGNNTATEESSYCKFCSNGVHTDCFQKWSYGKQESGDRVSTCIYCHSMWIDDTQQQQQDQQQQLKKRKMEPDMDSDSGYGNLDYSTSHRGEEFGFDRLYTHGSRPKLDREWRS